MGAISLTTQNRLYWLGRYSERVYTTIQMTLDQYDRLIEGEEHGRDAAAFCRDNGIPNLWSTNEEFTQHFMFDLSYPFSIYSNVENMLGNGMVLRETLSSPTLAYLQMARNAMEAASQSDGPMVQLQWVLDDIMAFRGSLDDEVSSDNIRNIVKTAASVERLSLMLRNSYRMDRFSAELMKFLNRLYKTDLPYDPDLLSEINRVALEGAAIDPYRLTACIEGLFSV